MNGTWIIAGIGFFFVFAIAAVIAFKILKKTVKMAMRMTIVGIILLVAVIGAVAFFFYGSSDSKRTPTTQTPRRN
jgi:glucan phosphoethanolaminetransferase (alkaline phosphatase superfamily)